MERHWLLWQFWCLKLFSPAAKVEALCDSNVHPFVCLFPLHSCRQSTTGHIVAHTHTFPPPWNLWEWRGLTHTCSTQYSMHKGTKLLSTRLVLANETQHKYRKYRNNRVQDISGNDWEVWKSFREPSCRVLQDRLRCTLHAQFTQSKKKQQQVYYSRRDYGRAYNERTTETTILSLHTVLSNKHTTTCI